MKASFTAYILGFAIALFAAWSMTHRYEFHAQNNFVIYKCDRWTGNVWRGVQSDGQFYWRQAADKRQDVFETFTAEDIQGAAKQ